MAIQTRTVSRTACGLTAMLLSLGGSLSAPPVHADTVDISPTPPGLTTTVAPNIVVTFDDSGSMGYDYMGDDRPFDGGSWNRSGSDPWRCAAVIDPNATAGTLRAHAMNGVYYNPNIIYAPPVYADGTSFPDADATLRNVWNDGIRRNRPRNAGSTSTTDFTNDGWYGWECAGDNDRPRNIPDSGPYYYKYTGPDFVNSDGSVDTRELYDDDNWTAVAVTNTDVTIDGQTVGQWQNWANWWAYYHDRNLMARTALSRVFGEITTSLHVAWQNINDNDFKLPGSAIISNLVDLPSCTDSGSANPETIQQEGGTPRTAPDCYRSAFFNWIFATGASGGTPDRSAAKRAGQFFERDLTEDLHDPYWNGAAGSDSRELTCRQNFHMLVTDGYWNGDNGISLPGGFSDKGTFTLPDGVPYNPSSAESQIYKGRYDRNGEATMADIALYYWGHDLQPNLDDEVASYMKNLVTGITGSTPLKPGDDPMANKEIYFNPNNDPAVWQHVVQFMVTLGIEGELTYSDDADCADPNNDLCKLRKGEVNSSGQVGWPRTDANGGQGVKENIDDIWHAAINSRGSYFSASDPSSLVTYLKKILGSISNRNSSSVAGSLNTSVLTTGALSYAASYNSDGWNGDIQAHKVSGDGEVDDTALWSAAAELYTRSATNRLIATGKIESGSLTGIPFEWSDLDTLEQAALNTLPGGGADSYGHARLNWLRGDRSQEGSLLRTRRSVLGAVIHSQPLYVAYPASGYRNYFPTKINGVTVDAPENDAMASDSTNCAQTSSCHSYEQFAYNHRDRTPVIYVGANDGMLHAFDASQQDNGTPSASAGRELWAYVPRAVYGKLSAQTVKNDFKFMPTVDGPVVTRDVFFSEDQHDEWHSILVGSLGLGGRGIYAIDITNPEASNESGVASKVLWEFTSESAGANPDDPSQADNPANLGYTFGQPNIGRLANGKWVVLVPGGYFPDCSQMGAPTQCDDSIKAADNTFSSLFVLDAQTGALIRELRTPTSVAGKDVTSSGLASPVLGDYNDDQVSDVAFAGDLEGDLWRFDLSDPDPANWKVNLIYRSATPGVQPITSMPRLFPDPFGKGLMVVFGTGKFLGLSDRVSGSNEPTQTIYGIREPGTATNTVWTGTDLVGQEVHEQSITDDEGNTLIARGLTNNPVPADKGGWYFDLPVNGERVVVSPGALFNTNRVIINTLIPGNNDPCNPVRKGAVMVVDAATGGASQGIGYPSTPSNWQKDGITTVGGRVDNTPTSGTLPIATQLGGGKDYIPGITFSGGGTFSISDSIWRRRSWRILNMGE